MVGPWPLAPHHDHLQYIHHVHLMQRGQNRGVTDFSCIPFDISLLRLCYWKLLINYVHNVGELYTSEPGPFHVYFNSIFNQFRSFILMPHYL